MMAGVVHLGDSFIPLTPPGIWHQPEIPSGPSLQWEQDVLSTREVASSDAAAPRSFPSVGSSDSTEGSLLQESCGDKVCNPLLANPTDAFEYRYDERNPFVVCNGSMLPIYRGSALVRSTYSKAA